MFSLFFECFFQAKLFRRFLPFPPLRDLGVRQCSLCNKFLVLGRQEICKNYLSTRFLNIRIVLRSTVMYIVHCTVKLWNVHNVTVDYYYFYSTRTMYCMYTITPPKPWDGWYLCWLSQAYCPILGKE